MKRYAIGVTFDYGLAEREHPDGDWVSADDALALQRSLDAVKAQAVEWAERATAHVDRIHELEAENSHLRGECGDSCRHCAAFYAVKS